MTLGVQIKTGLYLVESFTGDGSTVNFPLKRAPGNVGALDIVVAGVPQTTSYSVNGTTLTFSSPPANGAAIWVRHLGEQIQIGQPSANTVGMTQLHASTMPVVVGRARADDGAAGTHSGDFPADDTIPQNTEGSQWITLAYTPRKAGNKLKIRSQVHLTPSAAPNDVKAALFRDSVADAMVTSVQYASGAGRIPLTLDAEYTAPSTATITFKVRVASPATNVYVNGTSGGGPLYGGTFNSFIEVEEVLQ